MCFNAHTDTFCPDIHGSLCYLLQRQVIAFVGLPPYVSNDVTYFGFVFFTLEVIS